MAKATTLYRYITGPDDDAFCHRMSEILSRGWVLYGHPTLTYDEKRGRVICGQAVIKDVEKPYSPEMKLNEQ